MKIIVRVIIFLPLVLQDKMIEWWLFYAMLLCAYHDCCKLFVLFQSLLNMQLYVECKLYSHD